MWPEVVYTDQELLLSMKEGDKEAFTLLYHRYSVDLYKNLLPMVKSPQIAEEIIQDLFLKVWEKRASIKIEGSMVKYLYRIGENLIYDFYRKAAEDKQLKEHLAYYLSSATRNTEVEPVQQEEMLAKAIGLLSPQRQKVFRLCKLEGKSYQEVSQLLGITIATVNDHIVKATKIIQKSMANQMQAYLFLFILLEGLEHISII